MKKSPLKRMILFQTCIVFDQNAIIPTAGSVTGWIDNVLILGNLDQCKFGQKHKNLPKIV